MEFPLERFRLLYPQFSLVPDAVVLAWAEEARCLLTGRDCGCEDSEWMLLTAHFLALNGFDQTPGDGTVGNVASASIDKVSVSFVAPPPGDDWSYWLGATRYGKMLLALLAVCRKRNSLPLYAGSLPERAAFRSVYGVFPGRGRR